MEQMLFGDAEYIRVLDDIKTEIAQSRARAVLSVNSEMICMYWRIGSMIDNRAEWGAKFIDSLAHDIRLAYPGVRGFSSRNLKYMLRFARAYDFEFVQQVVAQIPWGHIVHLMEKVPDQERRNWYISQTIEHGWSRAVLMHQVSMRLFERQVRTEKVSNFDRLLPPADSEMVEQAMKDPYIFDFMTVREDMREKEIEDEMVRNVTELLLELGTGFGFMGRQYHLVVADKDYYVDLLFYNKKLRRYVVIELKATEFKPEYTGQLGFYVCAIDEILCDDDDKPTIGLLLCKSKDNAIAEYSLRSSSVPIGVSEYRMADELPDDMRGILPSPEEILNRI